MYGGSNLIFVFRGGSFLSVCVFICGQVVKVCGKREKGKPNKTYNNQCLAECDGAEPLSGDSWEPGVPCKEDIQKKDEMCQKLVNQRVVCGSLTNSQKDLLEFLL